MLSTSMGSGLAPHAHLDRAPPKGIVNGSVKDGSSKIRISIVRCIYSPKAKVLSFMLVDLGY